MNILLFDEDEVSASGLVTVRDRRSQHLQGVLKAKVGQALRAGIVRGPMGRATVRSLRGDSVELDFEATEHLNVPALSLVLALPRPKALSRMVQAAASFSVQRIDVINAWRVDASYFKSHKLDTGSLELEARLGCEQGGITYVPSVTVHRYFAPYVQEVLAPRFSAQGSGSLLVGHPSEPGFTSSSIEDVVLSSTAESMTLVFGPDGGFVEKELVSLTALGGRLVSFSDTVLRSETALVAGLSQLALLRRLTQRVSGLPTADRAAESRS